MSFKLDKRKACPVSTYAQGVINGEIIAGKYVRLACERHIKDLESAHLRGFYFDRFSSERAIYFIEQLRHTKGEWAGRNIELGGWQKFCIGSIFGWKVKLTGLRRFKTVYKQVGRKNGKSTECGGVGLYLLCADDEPGAEVYTAATKKDQAAIVFEEARNMVKALPVHYELRQIISVWKNMLQVVRTASKMLPMSSDDKKQDGLNPSGAVVDEFHAHKSRALLDVIDTGMGARRQPLMFIITTAGYDKKSACYEQRDYGIKILQGIIEDDSLFVFIAEIDEGDDPFDEKNWIKANPNLGISVKLDYLRNQAKKAKEINTFYNEFLTKHMNLWTDTETKWLKSEDWNACNHPVDLEKLKFRPCHGGLDLSSTTDLAAFVKVWPPFEDDPLWYVHCRFWLPSADLRERIRRDRVPYDAWERQGYLTLTDGPVIDYNVIQKAIEDDWNNFNIVDIGFDPHNATMIITNLMGADIEVVSFRQGFLSMSPAVKQAEVIILNKNLAHGGNPILTWMCDNTVMSQDAADNLKPDKEKARQRIDGIVAMLMGIGRATAEVPEQESYTLTHGVATV